MKYLYLIDGSGFIFRAYHALPPLTRSDKTPVGAVFGFCQMIIKLTESLREDNNSALAVVFDAGRKTFRNDLYPEYKAHRPPAPEDLIPQFPLIREACKSFNLPSIEMEGYEADDIIATLARKGKADGYEVVIVSADKDLMQLIEDKITLYDPLKQKKISLPEVMEKFGVLPEQLIDALALIGDSSDNVPGVPKIGPKTAAQLIQEFGNIENLYDKIDSLPKSSKKQTLTDSKAMAFLSKQLVTLHDKVPISLDLTALSIQTLDLEKAKNFCLYQGFSSLAKKLDSGMTSSAKSKSTNYKTIQTISELEEWLQGIGSHRVLAIDTETTSLNARQARLVGVSMSYKANEAVYVPLTHQTLLPQIPLQKAIDILKPYFLDPAILKVGHNIKYDMLVLKKYGLNITPYNDTMQLSYVLDMGKNGHGMDELALLHLNHTTIKFSEVAGTGKNQKTFDYIDLDKATTYAAEDADITLQLYEVFSKRLVDEKLCGFYEKYECHLPQVICDMEDTGVYIDTKKLTEIGKNFKEQIERLEKEIFEKTGQVFNIASPKQLGAVLFEDLKFPPPKKSKTGYSTDVDVLTDLAMQGYTLADLILEWRSLSKLNSTYVEALTNIVNPHTKRIHTSFSLATTTTGRLASSDPNLQNIPIRTIEGKKIRSCFTAEQGNVILSLDYSQIELRLLAHMAEIPDLIYAFNHDQDIHILTASQVFGCPIEEVTPEMRRKSKAINFGIIYGISPFGLSQNLRIPQEDARNYINTYFTKYPGIQEYMIRMKQKAQSLGYVETLFGRRCHIKNINDNNPALRGFAERQAINAPLQGSNADLIKLVMIKIPDLIKQKSLNAKMILQVHDELLFEVHQNDVERTSAEIKKLMESIVTLKVPLKVGSSFGDNWEEAH